MEENPYGWCPLPPRAELIKRFFSPSDIVLGLSPQSPARVPGKPERRRRCPCPGSVASVAGDRARAGASWIRRRCCEGAGEGCRCPSEVRWGVVACSRNYLGVPAVLVGRLVFPWSCNPSLFSLDLDGVHAVLLESPIFPWIFSSSIFPSLSLFLAVYCSLPSLCFLAAMRLQTSCGTQLHNG